MTVFAILTDLGVDSADCVFWTYPVAQVAAPQRAWDLGAVKPGIEMADNLRAGGTDKRCSLLQSPLAPTVMDWACTSWTPWETSRRLYSNWPSKKSSVSRAASGCSRHT